MPDKRINSRPEDSVEDPLGSSLDDLATQGNSSDMDRRSFLMRSALIGAMGVITGHRASAQIPASAEPKGVAGGPGNVELSPNLAVVKEQKGPVLTILDEFYKVGPGPSSSHTRLTEPDGRGTRNIPS